MVGSTGTVVTVYRSLADMPPATLALFRDSVGTEAPGGLAWHRLLAQDAMSLGQQTLFYVVSAGGPDGKPLAVLPMRMTAPSRRSFRPRGPQTLATMWTTRCHPLLADSVEDPAPLLRALIAAIVAEPECDGIKLEPLAREEPIFDYLLDACRQAGLVVQTFFSFSNWYLEVGGRSADEFFADLPPRLGHTISQKTRRLTTSGRSRIQVFTGGEGIEEAIADCERVYRTGWQSAERYQGFLPGLMRACANQGWLRLGLLYVDEEPGAVQFWIVPGRSALVFSQAYDERFAKLSLGTVLMAHMMRRAIDVDRVEVVDCLQGDDAYKREWMSHRRERWGILAMNPRTTRGVLGILRHVVGRFVKRALLAPLRLLRRLVRRLRG